MKRSASRPSPTPSSIVWFTMHIALTSMATASGAQKAIGPLDVGFKRNNNDRCRRPRSGGGNIPD